jgi:hypothetical protein
MLVNLAFVMVITHRHFLGARIRAMRLISARPLARESNL